MTLDLAVFQGALSGEHLGVMKNGAAETRPDCFNFLVAGAVASGMRNRLNDVGVVQVYERVEFSEDGEMWTEVTTKVLHHAARVV